MVADRPSRTYNKYHCTKEREKGVHDESKGQKIKW
jgi:hypothetical protein